MKRFIRFRKIGQFRNTVKNIIHSTQFNGLSEDGTPIYDYTAKLPTITFYGTTKSHGTNAGVVMDSQGETWYQSRKNIITVDKDNQGFAFFANTRLDIFKTLIDDIRTSNNLQDKTITIFGEWIGQGIQSGCAIHQISKRFIIFAVKVSEDKEDVASYYLETEKWKHLKSVDNDIYNVNDFKTFSIDIDFNNPKLVQNTLSEYTLEVEKQCPIGKYFGVDGIGEGIVWKAEYDGATEMFKTKGEKHSATKVKTLSEVDVEKLNSISEFVEYTVTENRLNQAIEEVFTVHSNPPTIKEMGNLIRWVVNDIMSEELDTLTENKLEPKDVNKSISIKVRTWFMLYLDNMVLGN